MKTFKLIRLLFPVLLLIAVTSCKKAEVTPPIQQGTLPSDAHKSSGAAVTYNYQTDIDLSAPGWYDFNSCTGELMSITGGIWHIVMHGMTSDHAFLASIHNNIQNFRLVSLETGIEYRGNSVNNFHYNFPLSNLYSFTLTLTTSVVLTTAGGGNNSKLQADFHLTVNPNGTLTASVDNFRAGCQ